MEIKDVNNLVNQILGGKTDLRTIAFDSAFAEMIKEKTDETKSSKFTSNQEVSSVAKTAKKQTEIKSSAKTEVNVSKDTSSSASSNIDTKSQVSSKTESKNKVSSQASDKTEKVTAEKEVSKSSSVEKNEKSQDKNKDDTDVQAVAAPIEAPVQKISEKVIQAEKPALNELDYVDSADAPVIADASVAENASYSDEIAPQVDLVLDQDAAPQMNSDTGEVKTAVAEFPEIVPNVTEEISLPVDSDMATETKAKASEIDIAINAEKTKETQKNANIQVEASAVAVDYSEEGTIPAHKISEIIGSDKNLKLSVIVKEEIFAYSDKKLVNNTVEVAEAVDAALNVDGSDTTSSASQTSNQSFSAQKQAQVPVNSFAANSAAAQVVTTPNVTATQTAAAENQVVADLSISNVSGAQVSGKTALNSELAIKGETKSASNDTYKGMSKEVVDQVKVNITKSAVKGIDKINIQLKPEELGSIEVKMQIGKDGKVQAHIVANKPETMEILQKDAQSLEKAFNAAGFQTDGESLSFSYRQQEETENRAQLKSFIGNSIEKETEVANQDYSLNSNGSLNIRV
ncbi:MAG: flagellar hook-length control protein FliK [Alphaproteobacteria bacterium]